MDFSANKTPVKVIKKGAFGRTYFWDKSIYEKNCKKVKVKLVNMIKDVNGKFDDYSISPKIRQNLFHWGYELTEKDFFY